MKSRLLNEETFTRFADYLQNRKRRDLQGFRDNFLTAAVLVLFDLSEPQKLLFIKRSSHNGHHRGQFAFPGGIHEKIDADLIQTAVREAKEEVGLPENCANPLGYWDDYPVPSGFIITPVIARLKCGFDKFNIDPQEIDFAFWEPLESFVQNPDVYSRNFELEGIQRTAWYYPTRHGEIWGATGAIVHDVLECIQKLENFHA